jgi:hypothetical protein
VVLLLLLGVALWRGLAVERPLLSGASRPVAAHSGAGSHRGLSILPLAAQGVVSAVLGSDSGTYRVGRLGAGYQAVNPAQGLRVRFGRAGVRVQSGGVRLGLRLGAVGYGASLVAVAPVAPRARGNRVVYARAGLSEWYANGPLGLEQGFTLARAPVGDSGMPLTLSLALSGDARVSVDASGRGLTLAALGSSSLRYANLLATDARGRTLHSWVTLQGGWVLLHVDARGARFPLRIDPLIQQGAKLTGKEETGKGYFGYSVALSADGNTALVGGPLDNSSVGAAWVFVRAEGKWTQQGGKLTGEEATGLRYFGNSVALSSNGNTALIGGPYYNGQVGAAWVFTRSEGKWTQQAKITGKEETGEGHFGNSVALSSDGNTALVGGFRDSTATGAAWVFTRSEGKWTQQGGKLTGKEETGEGWFGYSVALASNGGNTALIGGEADNSHTGAAWVFTRSEGKWTQQGGKLTGGSGNFGNSVALSSEGNTALVGALSYGGVGGAWVFTRSEGKWTQQAKLTSEGETGEGEFGSSVALAAEGNTALIGGESDNKYTGGAWVFTRSEAKWTQQGAKLTGKEETGEGSFGSAAALSAEGHTALIGGPSDNEIHGAAWVFASGPTATTGSATGITEAEATLHGKVNPEGAETKYYFEYGTTESYGSKTAEASVGSGTSNVEVSKAITGLSSNTKYHYRLVAKNSNGTTDGTDQTFTTTHWAFQELPLLGNKEEGLVSGVSCASSTACISVGSFQNSSGSGFLPLAEKWNGTGWSAQEPPAPAGGKFIQLYGVSCSSSTACTAVDGYTNSSEKEEPYAEKWNGTEWSLQEPPAPTGSKGSGLLGVSCTSSTACTAVGYYENSSGQDVPLAEKWNGTTWSLQEPSVPTGSKGSELIGVSCMSSTACTAVGYYENSSGQDVPLAEKWNGTTWSLQEPPLPTGSKYNLLWGVSCTSSTACIAVGEYTNSSEKREALVEKWNGTEWSLQEPPLPTGRKGDLLRSVSCTSSTECTAVGGVLNGTEGYLPLAEKWNGTAWTAQEPPAPTGTRGSILEGVSCTSSNECFATGYFANTLGRNLPLAELMS